ncbi:MAG: 4Fe-4S binding protein [Oscillospiraceae bacterium]|nr:4Fe-4S binding protein [Oscillospiraceae bacterium]
MAIIVDAEKCIGCSICVKECPFDAMTMVADNNGRKAPRIDSSCTECGRCAEVCPKGIITSTGTGMKNVDISLFHGVWIFAEHRDGELLNVSIELLGAGRKLADEIGTELCAILVGSECDNLVKELFAYGAKKVYYANNPELKEYTTDGYTAAVYRAILKYKPEIVLYGATSIGNNLASYVAVKCCTGLTTDCIALDIDQETKNLRQTCPAFGMNQMATFICPNHRPQMSTVRPGVMSMPDQIEGKKGEVVDLNIKFRRGEIRQQIIEAPQQIRDALQQVQNTSRTFVSFTKGWEKCIVREKEYWEQTDRNLSRALRFAKGDTALDYYGLLQKVISALDEKRLKSKIADEEAKAEIARDYSDKMEAAEQNVVFEYNEAIKRRRSDYESYCQKQKNAKTAKEFDEIAALFSRAGMKGYEDCDVRAKQCSAEAARMTEEAEKIAAAAAEKLKEGIALRDQERKKLEAEIDSLSKELAQTKGLFAGKRKKELEDQIMLTKSKLQRL